MPSSETSSEPAPDFTGRQLRKVIDHVEEGVYAVGSDWRFTYVNRQAKKWWGWEGEELIGRHIWEEFSEAGASVFYREHRRALQEQKTVRFETKCPAAGRWMEVVIYPSQEGLTVQFRDISAQKQVQEQGRRGEHRYRKFFTAAGEAIVISTPEGYLLDANPATAELLGFTTSELQQKRLPEFFAERRAFKQVARRLVSREIICALSSTAEYNRKGQTVLYYSFLRDVTEQKRAEQALEESERKFRQVTEQSLLGVALIQDGTFQYVNPRAAEIFGYEPEELTGGMGPEDTVHPGDWPRVKGHIQQRQAGEKEEARYQFRGLRKDGSVIYVEVHGRRISGGGRPAVLSHLLEVTERRRLRNRLLDVQEEERRRLGQELHDSVASQMTGIALILSSYEHRLEAREPLSAEEIRRVKEQVQDGEAQLRRLSRGLHPGSLEGSFTEALGKLAQSIDERFSGRCECDVREAANLDQPQALHLYRIAQEAATNALRHGDPGAVRIACQSEGQELVLTITDDGQGFAPEETSEGLGLSSMRYRAEILGADLSITSRPGEGTKVCCQLLVELT